jgi:VanZ family protein
MLFMCKLAYIVPRWSPALLIMLIIFLFSSQPASELPDFARADILIKKGGHVIGYAILAFAYWYALGLQRGKRWLAWLLALLYAATDEFHQSFVPGRYASIWDVLIFDNLGGAISLWVAGIRNQAAHRRTGQPRT